MNAILIYGCRNQNGQTARDADAILAGMIEAEASVEKVFLPVFTIEHCRQCEDHG